MLRYENSLFLRIRRILVVCPPFWLLPRIETGDSFYGPAVRRCCGPHPQGNVPAWAFAGRTFRRLWGMSVPFSLSAPAYYYARQSWQFFVVILNSLQINALPMKKTAEKSPHISAV